MGIRKVGDWDLAGMVTSNLRKDLEHSRNLSLRRFALKGEAIAKKHIAKQDLNWQPLKDKYRKWKRKKGFSTATLIKTSSYVQAITSWVSGMYALVGVKRDVKNEEGETIANIARIHEYGSKARNIPARRLWFPSYEEALKWWYDNATPIKLYFELMSKKYGIKRYFKK